MLSREYLHGQNQYWINTGCPILVRKRLPLLDHIYIGPIGHNGLEFPILCFDVAKRLENKCGMAILAITLHGQDARATRCSVTILSITDSGEQ